MAKTQSPSAWCRAMSALVKVRNEQNRKQDVPRIANELIKLLNDAGLKALSKDIHPFRWTASKAVGWLNDWAVKIDKAQADAAKVTVKQKR